MNTNRRRFYAVAAAGTIVAAVIVLLLVLSNIDDVPTDDPLLDTTVADVEEDAIEVATQEVPAPVAPAEPAEEVVEPEKEEAPEDPERDPSLRGVVSGGSESIAGARVLLFSFRFVEGMIRRIERLASTASPTDVPHIITMVKKELGRIRDGGTEALTNAEGHYTFYRLAPGSYFVLVVAPGYVFEFGEVVVIQKEQTTEHHVSMSRGEMIAGRVVDAEGDPVSGAKVLAVFRPPGIANVGKIVQKVLRYVNGEFLRGPFEKTTEADGRFEISSLPPGLYDLVARAPAFPDATMESVLSGTTEAVVVLKPGKSVIGKLVTARGDVLANRQIRLGAEGLPTFLPIPGGAEMMKTVERIVEDPDRLADSNAEGEFWFGDVASGRFLLEVDVAGYLPVRRSVQVKSEEESDTVDLGEIRVEVGQSIEGVVRDNFGGTVSNASVAVFAQRTDFNAVGSTFREMMSGRNKVEADEFGKFVVAGLSAGKYSVMAEASGHGRVVESEVAAGSQVVELVLRRGVDIEGEVHEVDSEEPLRGIEVYCAGSNTKTDEDGRFTLKSVAPRDEFNPFGGPARRHPKGQEEEKEPVIEVRFSNSDFESETRRVPLTEVNRELKVSLRRRPTIEGRVLDPDGEPVVGVLLRLVPGDSDEPFLAAGMIFVDASVSRLEGEFKLKPLESNGSYFVLASHPLYATTPGPKFTLTDGKVDEDIEVRMVPPARVFGKVSDGVAGVGGVTMRLSPVRENSGPEQMFMRMFGMPEPGTTEIADSEGQFRFERVLPGDYTLTARTRGYGETRSEKVTIAEKEEREINITLDPGGEIAGRALTADGEGLSGVRLRLIRANQDVLGGKDALEGQKMFGGYFKAARSGSDGAFEFESLPDGDYTLVAEKGGFVSHEIPTVTPGKDVAIEIILEESARLSGEVVNGATGTPLPEYQYKLRKDGVEDPLPFFLRKQWEFAQDSSGRFVINDLAPGTYALAIRATGYLPIEEPIVLRSGESREVRMTLSRAGKFEGTVVDAQSGGGIADVAVRISAMEPAPGEEELEALHARLLNEPREALSAHWNGHDGASSTSHGSFEVDNFPEGEQTVVFAHPEYVSERRPGIKIEAGEANTLDIVLRKGLEVTGMLRDASGQPVGNAHVALRGTAAANLHVRQYTRSNSDGSFRVSGLLGGRYVVAARKSRAYREASPVALEVDLVDGGIEGLEVALD